MSGARWPAVRELAGYVLKATFAVRRKPSSVEDWWQSQAYSAVRDNALQESVDDVRIGGLVDELCQNFDALMNEVATHDAMTSKSHKQFESLNRLVIQLQAMSGGVVRPITIGALKPKQENLAWIAARIRQLAPATESHNGKMLANVHRMTCEAVQRGAFADVRLAPLRDYFDDRMERRPFGSASWNMFAALHWLADNAVALGVPYPTNLPSIAIKHWGLAFPKADCVRAHVHAFADLIEAVGRRDAASGDTTKKAEAAADEGGLLKRVQTLERESKQSKRLTQREKIRKQRNDFSCSRRRKNPPVTWQKIYDAYNKRFPKDKDASASTLRLSHDRNCQKCRTV